MSMDEANPNTSSRVDSIKHDKSSDGTQLTEAGEKMRLALMLSVAYSANLCGTGVVTGTVPNLILMSELEEWVILSPSVSKLYNDYQILGICF